MKIANRKIAIMLVSMMSLPIIQSAQAAQQLSSNERTYLTELIACSAAHVAQLSGQLHSFFDTKGNKESYSAHVQKFGDILISVEGSIVTPLENEMRSTSHAEYKALLEQMFAIVMDLHANLTDAYNTFKKNEGKGFLAVSNALGNLKEKVGKRLPMLEKRLNTLHRDLVGFDAELAQAVDRLIKSLPKVFEIKLSNMVIVTRVKQRIDY